MSVNELVLFENVLVLMFVVLTVLLSNVAVVAVLLA